MVLRKRVQIEGVVQGVGFRPFVYNAARQWKVAGWVLNNSEGVTVEAEGEFEGLAGFLWTIRSDTPPLASVTGFHVEDIEPLGETGFEIRQSEESAVATAQISPDTHVCEECLAELFDSNDRRFRYPFINCTNCGPRYTIVTRIPYDRPNTTMADFPMCDDCSAEYDDPGSRRFHAQPNACPACGPQLSLLDADGNSLDSEDPIKFAVERLREGRILAIKGLGGYHLAVDAENSDAVAELRRRKQRDEKPFAIMSYDSETVVSYCRADADEIKLLSGPERPIVLLPKANDCPVAGQVASGNRFLGVMLPYTPLHYLLLKDNFTALVMTSGNISDEPIAYEDDDATTRLSGIADFFLLHNRRIHTRTDDSIARIQDGRTLMLRRSRGFVPRPVFIDGEMPQILATGAELKSTFCLTSGNRAYLSQHIGDLKNADVYESFRRAVDHLEQVLEITPEVIAHDLHPDLYSTLYAEERDGVERIAVQHHHAHMASCLAENGHHDEAIGVIFDGLGYGIDGRIWGGEFLAGGYGSFRRMGHFSHIPMPGGDAAVKEPYRMALSYLIHVYGEDLPDLELVRDVPAKELKLLRQMIDKEINSPMTSSCGRLFDGVAALVGLRREVSFEGQAAMELEQVANPHADGSYPFNLWNDEGGFALGYPALISAIVEDIRKGVPAAEVSGRFHNTLANLVLSATRQIWSATGLDVVALSGGVFQNRLLTTKVRQTLQDDGFRVLTHSAVPPNDGGLALGQAVIAARHFHREN